MKCRVCGGQASVSLKAYNTALCAGDFVSFLEKRVLTTIQKYRLITDEDSPVVAVSGGKDSLSLWYMMNKLGYGADGIYVHLGIEGYSDASLARIKTMAKLLNRKVFIFYLYKLFEKGIDQLARPMRRTACSACGMVKRYVMNRICMDKGYTVLVTGHNLDDEASALFGNLLYWKEEYLWKKNIMLEGKAQHLSKKVKPLFLCSEREMAAYALICGIDYIYEECPFSLGAKSLFYKNILNGLEEKSPGTKIQFVKGYLRMVREDNTKHRYQKLTQITMEPPPTPCEGEKEGTYCVTCGYFSNGDKCNMCRMLERFGVERAVSFEEYDARALT